MSEERTQYTVHPDVLVRLETSEKYIKQLESTNNGLTMVIGRHAETITAQRERIAELEATVLRQMETIARLEADNRRLRHLDAMPVDAMERLLDNCDWKPDHDYPIKQYSDDWNSAIEWVRFRTVTHD